MADSKEKIRDSVLHARADLDEALDELEKLPALDPGAVAFAAHALNNYLSVTTGTVQLLALWLTDYPDKNVQELLEALLHATHLMTHTVNRLTNVSTTNGVRLKLEDVDLGQLVGRACEYHQQIAARKNIRVRYTEPKGAAIVWADKVAVAAILDNLASNAIKYSPPNSEIRVEVRATANGVACTVSDDGPGLTAAEQARVFERGVQLSPKPTAGEASAGYGLSVAKELTDHLGGEISCVSEPGKGASFTFVLPTTAGKSVTPRGPAGGGGPQGTNAPRV
jgi:two-component system, sensor histidine kinase and response regulator